MGSKKGKAKHRTTARSAGITSKRERIYEVGYLPVGKESYEYDSYEDLQSNYHRVEVKESDLLLTISQVMMNPGIRLEYITLKD